VLVVGCGQWPPATLPPTLTVVSVQLFVLCGQLHSIALAMTRIPDGCLRRVKSLKVFGLRKFVRDTGEGAFEGCEVLETLRLEEGLVLLGESCFKGARH
jgi:hypothetical protein